MSERVYIEEAELYDLDIPHGWIVGRDDDGRIYMEEDDSGGSPGSWPIDDEESDEDEADDVPPDAGGADDRQRIGPRMLDVTEFVRANPGACKAEVRRGVGLYPNPFGYSETPLERASATQCAAPAG